MSKLDEAKPFHTEEGIAKDQEAIVRLRPDIEDYIASKVAKFSETYLEWNMNEDGTFWYKLYFFS